MSDSQKLSSKEINAKHKEYLFPSVANYYKEPLPIDRGEGMYIYTPEGRKISGFLRWNINC